MHEDTHMDGIISLLELHLSERQENWALRGFDERLGWSSEEHRELRMHWRQVKRYVFFMT
ncbi:glycosyltransferase family 90 protein [Moniliophthora roreri]|nr:glycosyltransferase family 90 protein [Moniliophthora roreri]